MENLETYQGFFPLIRPENMLSTLKGVNNVDQGGERSRDLEFSARGAYY